MSDWGRHVISQLAHRRAGIGLLALLLLGSSAGQSTAQGPPVVFRPPITYERPAAVPLAGVDGEPLHTADWDSDGRLDVAVVTQEGLSLIYGNGDGTFGSPVEYVLGQNLQEGTAADLNGDSLLDLLNWTDNSPNETGFALFRRMARGSGSGSPSSAPTSPGLRTWRCEQGAPTPTACRPSMTRASPDGAMKQQSRLPSRRSRPPHPPI